MNWIEQNHELAIAVLGPLLLALGYFYRGRLEKRANLKEALYLLLEIWHRMGLSSAAASEHLVERMISRIKVLFPQVAPPELEIEAAKAYFLPIINKLLREHAFSDFEGLQDAYKKAISLVARSHPVYAYKLESASSIRKRLAFLDQYFAEAFQPAVSQSDSTAPLVHKLREKVGHLAERDVLKEMEGRLLGLAWRVSIPSLFSVSFLVRKRRRTLNLDSAELDRWLLEVFGPMLSDPSVAPLLIAPGTAQSAKLNPSIERRSPDKPGAASHLKR